MLPWIEIPSYLDTYVLLLGFGELFIDQLVNTSYRVGEGFLKMRPDTNNLVRVIQCHWVLLPLEMNASFLDMRLARCVVQTCVFKCFRRDSDGILFLGILRLVSTFD